MRWIRTNDSNYFEDIFHAAKTNDKQTFRKLFLRLHQKDQMELFHQLYPEKKKKIAEFLTPKEFAPVLEFMELVDQKDAVHYLPAEYMAETFRYMADDNVVRFLNEVEDGERDALLAMMDEKDRFMVEKLMSYAPETAGSIMTTRMLTILAKETVGEVTKKLKIIGHNAETIYYLYVVDEDGRLLGVCSLRDLILSPETERIENIMFTEIAHVSISEDQETVARLIQDYDLLAIPVVAKDFTLLGIVTVDDVIDVMEEEVTEDFKEFSAIRKAEDGEGTVIQIARARIPWIVILIFLGMVSANLIGLFEETLESVVALAAFIPIIMDSAGNVGTQSLAVAVRRLTVDSKEKQPKLTTIIRKEFGVGMLIGMAAALAVFLLVWILYRDGMLAGVIGLSLFFTLSISAVIGAIVPVIINKMKIDPAIASGPFITTLNDTLGLFIYFSIATVMLKGT
ncbi:magnesium transporter [Atopococcus tabaci]|uniref:magnesium transporter n=1 Tax=Atopococcus tabaci TaxID=269774 RepID=UPI0024099812|nr:magnesium transporter [Atopococcus tabaci]